MGDVIHFRGATTAPLPPSKILEEASKEVFEDVLIVGFKADGSYYTACSTSDAGTAIWLMQRAERMIHKCADEMEG